MLSNKVNNNEISRREKEYYDDFFTIIKPSILDASFNLSVMFPGIIPENNLGKKILICSCGIGLYVIAALRTRAEVFAFDISRTAVEKAREYVKINGFKHCEISEMDFHKLKYDNEFFDIVFGTQILHHVDVEICGKEIYRVLNRGGIAVFEENSYKNPLIHAVRNLLFSKNTFGGRRSKGRFGFVRKGTDDENPLDEREIKVLKQIFRDEIKREYNDFIFFEMLSRHNKYFAKYEKSFKNLDKFIYNKFPFLRQYGFQQILIMKKQ